MKNEESQWRGLGPTLRIGTYRLMGAPHRAQNRARRGLRAWQLGHVRAIGLPLLKATPITTARMTQMKQPSNTIAVPARIGQRPADLAPSERVCRSIRRPDCTGNYNDPPRLERGGWWLRCAPAAAARSP